MKMKSLYTQTEEQKEIIQNSIERGMEIALNADKHFAKCHKERLKELEALEQLTSDVGAVQQCLFVVGGEANRATLKAHAKISTARINKAVEYMLAAREITQFKVSKAMYIASK